jgi:hypothetical protein
MPIKRMLKGRNFSPQSAAILVKAFNDVVDELDLRTLADRNRSRNNRHPACVEPDGPRRGMVARRSGWQDAE